jgi:hypothetical protein
MNDISLVGPIGASAALRVSSGWLVLLVILGEVARRAALQRDRSCRHKEAQRRVSQVVIDPVSLHLSGETLTGQQLIKSIK